MPNFSKSCITIEDIKEIAEGCIAQALALLPDETFVVDSVIDAEGNLFLIRNDGVQVPVPFVSDFTGIDFDNDGLSLDIPEICQALVADTACMQAIMDAVNTNDDTFAIPSTASASGTDSFGTPYGSGTTIVTYPNGDVVAHPSTEETLSDQCYDLEQLDSDCGAFTPVGWVDVNGCGKLVKAVNPPFPQGYQEIAARVNGTNDHAFTLTNTDVFYMGDPSTPNGSNFWNEIFPNPDNANGELYWAKVVFNKNDFCGLAQAGQTLQIKTEAVIGYFMDVVNIVPKTISHQWGLHIVANGTTIYREADQYPLNTTGFPASNSDIATGVWTTDGDDLCIEVYFILVALGSGVAHSATTNDILKIDLAKIGVTITPVN